MLDFAWRALEAAVGNFVGVVVGVTLLLAFDRWLLQRTDRDGR